MKPGKLILIIGLILVGTAITVGSIDFFMRFNEAERQKALDEQFCHGVILEDYWNNLTKLKELKKCL